MSELPQVVGLCPVHAGEFYMPHGGRCPDPGCNRELVEYVRDGDWRQEYEVVRRERDALADAADIYAVRIAQLEGREP